MAIELAPLVYVTRSRSQGHCGVRTSYGVKVILGDFTFYPCLTPGYQNPDDCGYDQALLTATRIGEALGFEVINQYSTP